MKGPGACNPPLEFSHTFARAWSTIGNRQMQCSLSRELKDRESDGQRIRKTVGQR